MGIDVRKFKSGSVAQVAGTVVSQIQTPEKDIMAQKSMMDAMTAAETLTPKESEEKKMPQAVLSPKETVRGYIEFLSKNDVSKEEILAVLDNLADDLEKAEDKNPKEKEITEKNIIEEYINFLSENNVSMEDVMAILDKFIESGSVFWECNLFGRIPAVFRTRLAWANELLTVKLETIMPKTYARYQEIIATHNIAASLVSYRRKDLKLDSREDFEANFQFVTSLPLVVVEEMKKELALFDRVISVATSNWAIENFMKPPSAE